MDVKVGRRLNELTATEIVARIAAGEITCEAVTRDCIERIAARDEIVKAWVNFNPELALAQAHALDREPHRGPLCGVPIGVKDVIDTFDMPTEMGSPIYREHRPIADAACVALLRRAGAVILGKTATCELAGMAPAATTNPHNATHTPGGSSSGSAAAVADFMVPAALGTQTGGSVLRPSSFCGVFGYKPTYNTFNKAGLNPAAESIDTIGWIGRSIEDIALLTAVLRIDEPQRLRSLSAMPRVGLCRTELWDKAQPETRSAVENAGAALSKAGAIIRDVTLPEAFAGLPALARAPSITSSAPLAWPSNGTIIAQPYRRRCGAISKAGSTRRARTISLLGGASNNAARCCRKFSATSTCCWRPVCPAKRRVDWLRLAIRACRRCGLLCTLRP
jgi:Asp-tRNA(Asn)/Glu-tRNA(Gln) amidotransferase A subunit family amidase